MLRLLLSHGASLDARDSEGRDAKATAVRAARRPDNPLSPFKRRAAARLLADVRRAGGWRAYVLEPRVRLLVLGKLVESGRAEPSTTFLARVFSAGPRAALPDKYILWKVLQYWRCERDPPGVKTGDIPDDGDTDEDYESDEPPEPLLYFKFPSR